MILFFAILLLAGLALIKRNISPNAHMTQQEANEYILRNLQPEHIQFYSRNASNPNTDIGRQITLPAQQLQKPLISKGVYTIKKLLKFF